MLGATVPRYDVPKAAPEPLRQVQLLVNSVDLENEVDWLPDWLAEHGLGEDAELRFAPRGDALDGVVAIAFAAMLDGTWSRLKACRNCRWCFYDYSPNRSATWCSMQLCGNRKKTRAYRARQRA